MLTKREVLKSFALNGSCLDISCSLCPYDKTKACTNSLVLRDNLIRIGAMALLRMFPEKREFDRSKIITCTTSYRAVVGMRGYFADNIAHLISQFKERKPMECLAGIRDESYSCRFLGNHGVYYSLFYPLDEVEE